MSVHAGIVGPVRAVRPEGVVGPVPGPQVVAPSVVEVVPEAPGLRELPVPWGRHPVGPLDPLPRAPDVRTPTSDNLRERHTTQGPAGRNLWKDPVPVGAGVDVPVTDR